MSVLPCTATAHATDEGSYVKRAGLGSEQGLGGLCVEVADHAAVDDV